MAEKNQEEQESGTQQDNQSEYLRIIDDLSSELSTLSRQVNMVQKDFLTDEIAKQFESSMKGLVTQNDLLQGAVESLIEEKENIERTLQTENEDLKSRLCNQEEELCALHNQISQLQQRPCERCAARAQSECAGRSQSEFGRGTPRVDSSEELEMLECELRRKTKAVECLKSENARLNDELNEIRRAQAKLKLLQRRSGGQASNNQDQETMAKLNAAQEKNKEQSKCLQKATKQIASLQQEIDELRSNENILSKERDLLQAELIALKESQASQFGTQQSLQEQLQVTIDELYDAKKKLHDCVQMKERIENVHRNEVTRFQDLKADMYEKYNNLVEDYNNVLKEYQKVVQIEQEKTNQIKAFNAWKDEQVQIEKEVRKKEQKFENHIKELLEDRQHLMDKLNEMENDNRTLLHAIERSRSGSTGNQHQRGGTCSPPRGYTVVVATSSTDPVSKVIESVRSTSRRLSQQRSILEEEASRLFSK